MKYFLNTVLIVVVLIYSNLFGAGMDKNNDESEFSVIPSAITSPPSTVYGRFRAGIDVNYFKSTESYDKEGNATENYGMDVFSRWNQRIKFSYTAVEDGEALNSKWNVKVGADASFFQAKWTPGEESSGGTEYSGSGTVLNLGGGAFTRNLFNSKVKMGVFLKYQFDLTGESDQESFAATDRQDALGIKLKSSYNFSENVIGYAGGSYWNTFSKTNMAYDYETGGEKEIKIDDGNYFSLFGGLSYKWNFDCGDLYAGLGLSYWGRSSQCYDDNETEDSNANSLSIIPKVGFKSSSIPLDIYLSGAAKDEYGNQQGIIDLSGKNTAKSSAAYAIGARYRF